MGVFDRHLNKQKRTTATPRCPWIPTLAISLSHRRLSSGAPMSARSKDLLTSAAPEPRITHHYPSITETLPPAYPGFRHEFGKLENLMWRGRRGNSAPPTRVLPEANDRIHSIGYNYLPVHTDIYGSYRNRDARRGFY